MKKLLRKFESHSIEKIDFLHSFDEAHKHSIRRIAVDYENKYIVSASSGGSIKIWRLQDRRLVDNISDAHEGEIFGLAITHDNRFFVSAGKDQCIKIWDITSRNCIDYIQNAHAGPITSLTITPDDKFIVSGSTDQSIRIFNFSTKHCVHRFPATHEEAVTVLVMTPDGRYLISSSTDRSINVYDFQGRKLVKQIKDAHSDCVTSLDTTIDNKYLISAGLDGNIKMWELEEFKPILVYSIPGKTPLVSISMSLDSQHLIVASQDRTIRIVDIKNKDIVTTIENAHQDAITHIQISSDNRYVISGSADKAIKIWDSSLYLDPINAYPTYRSNSENGANLAKVIEGINSKESQLVEENKKLLFELEILKKKYNELKNSMSQNHEVKTADQNSILTNDFFLKTESLPKNMPSLFLSVAFLMNEISSKSLKDLALVSKTILYVKKYASASILKYSGSFRQEELKNKTPEEYIKTLEEESYLGNVVDLKALSHHYKVSITVIRPTAKEGIKAESINEKEYNKAIFLLNDTKKSPNSYEPIVGSNESEEEIKVFSQEIYGEIKKEVISLVEGLSSI